MKQHNLRFATKTVSAYLAVATVVLTGAYIFTAYLRHYVRGFRHKGDILRMFHIGQENNIPAWFAIMILAIAAALIAIIAYAKWLEGDEFRRHWAGLAALFALLSLDEAASLHEMMGNILYRYVQTTGYLYYIWVIPGIIFVIALAIIFARFVWNLPVETRNLFILAGGLFLSGAIGFEMLAAPCLDECNSMGFSMLIAAEEFLEMSGVVLFIFALGRYLESMSIRFGLEFSKVN